MTVALKCPSCGASISEAAVVAVAPVCSNCRSVITVIGGTLGLTGAYGVSDSSITRRRVEADLAVFREYQIKYRGLKEACLQELDWSVERYAKLPESPELLTLVDVPDFGKSLLRGLWYAGLWVVGSYIALWILRVPYAAIVIVSSHRMPVKTNPSWIEISNLFYYWSEGWLQPENFIANIVVYIVCVSIVGALVVPHFKAKAANGERPRENARRQEAYEEAVTAALKVAEPLKAANDHRLRVQIRELESSAKVVDANEAEVRRLLATL